MASAVALGFTLSYLFHRLVGVVLCADLSLESPRPKTTTVDTTAQTRKLSPDGADAMTNIWATGSNNPAIQAKLKLLVLPTKKTTRMRGTTQKSLLR